MKQLLRGEFIQQISISRQLRGPNPTRTSQKHALNSAFAGMPPPCGRGHDVSRYQSRSHLSSGHFQSWRRTLDRPSSQPPLSSALRLPTRRRRRAHLVNGLSNVLQLSSASPLANCSTKCQVFPPLPCSFVPCPLFQYSCHFHVPSTATSASFRV